MVHAVGDMSDGVFPIGDLRPQLRFHFGCDQAVDATDTVVKARAAQGEGGLVESAGVARRGPQLQEPLLIRGYFSAQTHPLLAPLVPCSARLLILALLTPQIRRLDAMCERRRDICARYETAFADLADIAFPSVQQAAWSARHLFPVWVAPERRDDTIADLQERYRALRTIEVLLAVLPPRLRSRSTVCTGC